MTEAQKPRKKGKETPAQDVNPSEASKPKSTHILATGLEDYGRWKTMFNDHKRDANEKPFRRGRIWC